MSNRVQRRRLAKYKRRKDAAVAKKQMGEFMKWSLRFHRLCHRLYGPPNLWK